MAHRWLRRCGASSMRLKAMRDMPSGKLLDLVCSVQLQACYMGERVGAVIRGNQMPRSPSLSQSGLTELS